MIRETLKARRGMLVVGLSVAVLAIGIGSRLAAQDAASPAAAPDASAIDEPKSVAKLRKRRVVHKPAPPTETRSVAVTAPPATPVKITAPAKEAAPVDFAAQLDKAGASACHGQVNALATATMGSVVAYNTMSNWSEIAGGQHAVSLAIGQKYRDGSAVPFGVAQIISAPNQQGACDGFAVQVLPSPLSCGKLRDSLAAHGKQIGDLAGIALMQDGAGRTMLVPTAANSCVLVATRTSYAK